MSFRLPNPFTLLSGSLSPVDIVINLQNLDFGPSVKFKAVVTATMKLTGAPVPFLPLDLLLDGQPFKQVVQTDSNGQIVQSVTLTEEGTHTIEVIPSDLENFQSNFGPFIPTGSATLTIYALTFKAFNAGLGKDMNASITVSGKSFSTPTTILSPAMFHLSAAYPQVTQRVYALDQNEIDFDVKGDETFLVNYNAPGSITGSISFDESCIPSGGSVSGVVSGGVQDIGGNPMPFVPLSINGNNTQTDASGNFNFRVMATNPGTITVTVTTQTPISITKTLQQNLSACPSVSVNPTSAMTTTFIELTGKLFPPGAHVVPYMYQGNSASDFNTAYNQSNVGEEYQDFIVGADGTFSRTLYNPMPAGSFRLGVFDVNTGLEYADTPFTSTGEPPAKPSISVPSTMIANAGPYTLYYSGFDGETGNILFYWFLDGNQIGVMGSDSNAGDSGSFQFYPPATRGFYTLHAVGTNIGRVADTTTTLV